MLTLRSTVMNCIAVHHVIRTHRIWYGADESTFLGGVSFDGDLIFIVLYFMVSFFDDLAGPVGTFISL